MNVVKRVIGISAILLTILLTSGCDNDSRAFSKIGSDPEEIAISFVESIYESDSLDYAKSISSPRLAGLIDRYRTNRNVQKNLFYQMYDKFDIQSESQGRAGRQEYAKQAYSTDTRKLHISAKIRLALFNKSTKCFLCCI